MPIIPKPSQPGDDYDVGLGRIESGPGGTRHWREIFVAELDGFRPLTASVTIPPPSGRTPPLAIWIHGGGWFTGHRHVTNPSLDAMRIEATLLAAGYAVAGISYRLSGEARFPVQLQDCRAAIRYLRHHAGVFGFDPGRIGVIGESAGGQLALLTGMEGPAEFDNAAIGPAASSAVSCVVAWYPVTDFTRLEAGAGTPPARLLGQPVADDPGTARRASPLAHVSAGTAPTLLVHGTADTVVPIEQSEILFAALKAAGVAAEFERVEGGEHCFFNAETAEVMPRTIRFLDRWLKT